MAPFSFFFFFFSSFSSHQIRSETAVSSNPRLWNQLLLHIHLLSLDSLSLSKPLSVSTPYFFNLPLFPFTPLPADQFIYSPNQPAKTTVTITTTSTIITIITTTIITDIVVPWDKRHRTILRKC